MTKNFEELDDAFNVSGEIVPTESTEVGITKPERHERNDIEKTNKIKKELTLCIDKAKELNLGINAGHDLNLGNLSHLKECGVIDEVSIGHAIMTDALKFGFRNTIIKYLELIRND